MKKPRPLLAHYIAGEGTIMLLLDKDYDGNYYHWIGDHTSILLDLKDPEGLKLNEETYGIKVLCKYSEMTDDIAESLGFKGVGITGAPALDMTPKAEFNHYVTMETSVIEYTNGLDDILVIVTNT